MTYIPAHPYDDIREEVYSLSPAQKTALLSVLMGAGGAEAGGRSEIHTAMRDALEYIREKVARDD